MPPGLGDHRLPVGHHQRIAGREHVIAVFARAGVAGQPDAATQHGDLAGAMGQAANLAGNQGQDS
jgi:hypothetical protein